MKSTVTSVLLSIGIALAEVSSMSAQIFYPSSQLLKARKAKLIAVGEVIYRGKILASFSTHPGSTWQTVVFKLDEVLKGEEKGKYLRVAFFTEKELGAFTKGDKLILVLDDKSDSGCGENADPIVIKKEGNKTLRTVGNSSAFKEYETSSCYYAYPESVYDASDEELETTRLFLSALKSKN
jgi:hypothetical protein